MDANLNLIRISSPFIIFNKPHYATTSFLPFSPSKNISGSRNYQKLSSGNDAVFDEAAFESERLTLDAMARQSMAEVSKRETETDPKAWKWVIRKRVWDFMEAHNIAQNPRPVHHRIPNFVGAAAAAQKVSFFFLWMCLVAWKILLSLKWKISGNVIRAISCMGSDRYVGWKHLRLPTV